MLIDYQVGTLQLVKNLASDQALRNSVVLAKAGKALDMPMVPTTSQEHQIQGELAPTLRHVLPEVYENRIQRGGIVKNAWADPNFKAAVEATVRKQLVMGGITLDICRTFPSSSTVEDGFEV